MKKGLALGFLVLAGLWVAGVVFFGRAANIKVDDQIAALNRVVLEHRLPVAITKYSYESGFLSSRSRVQLNIERDNAEALAVDVDLDIYHGPLMWTPKGLKFGAYYIAFTPDMAFLPDENHAAKEFLEGFAGRKPISGHLLLGLWGGQNLGLELSPFSFSEDKQSVSLARGITGEFNIGDDFSRLKSTINIGPFSFADKGEALKVDIAASVLTMDITEFYAGNMLTGELQYTLDSIISRSKGSESRIEGISLYSANDKNDAGMYGSGHFLLQSIAADDESFKAMFGESLKFRFDINYEGLNERATREFAALNQTLNYQMYGALLSDTDISKQGALTDKNLQAYLLAIASLVQQGFKFDYGFSLGKGDANSGIDVVFEWVDAEGLMDKKTLRQVLTAFRLDVKATIDEAFLAHPNVKNMAQIPVVSGYAVLTEEGIESHGLFNRGELLLNGNPVSYMDKVGAALDEALPWAK